MWVKGTANGTYLRRSLKTASWERATELSRIIEESDKPAETPERKDAPVTIVQAVTEYLAAAKARERLGRISVTQAPTDYFTRDEYEKLIDATYLYRENRGETIGGTHLPWKCFSPGCRSIRFPCSSATQV